MYLSVNIYYFKDLEDNFYVHDTEEDVWIKILLTMPQLIPFFFVNQVLFNFALLTIMIYVFSKYLLPRFVRLFKTRLHINNI